MRELCNVYVSVQIQSRGSEYWMNSASSLQTGWGQRDTMLLSSYIFTHCQCWSQIIRISRLFCLHLYKSGYSKSFSSSNSERLISTLNCLRKEEMEVESGISTVPSVLLDDDGRPKRTGLLSLSFFSLSFIFSMQFSPLFLTQSLCWLD